ncbi:hypothetical protein [Fontivita pretiosa]|uniref:hypothetical protein n=1 Tax=Fontivita pretiosa TaxID=2989684 RepID=UPI003D1775F4
MQRCAPLFGMFVVFLCVCGCGRDATSSLKGQTNATLTFYGKAVDQDGIPLPGASFAFRLEAYPKDWTFETRGRLNEATTVTATSDENGLFQFTVTGCTLRRQSAEREGYRHFCDEDHGSSYSANNYFYTLIAWSDLWYKSDPHHPAVFVFVKDGVREVSALPCKGGYDSVNGKNWTLNKPGWPRKPSLKDVVQKRASTQATTQLSTQPGT